MLTKIIVIKLFLILIMIIFECKNPKSVIFWFFIILLIPFGFILYLIFGNRLKLKAKGAIVKSSKNTKNYLKKCWWYGEYIKKSKSIKLENNKLSVWLKNKYNIDLWQNNKIKILNQGQQFLDNLLKDLSLAKKYIFLEFYIFADDKTGHMVAEKLKEKACNGIQVKIIYDAIGARKTNGKFWEGLKQCGIEVLPYFPSFFNIGMLNLKANYRNHRKIVVIDGRIAYIGGINLRDDHMGKDKKLKPWQDVMAKIEGNAVYPIINTFLNDYVYASKNQTTNYQIQFLFPKPIKKSGSCVNIISAGPETDAMQIKNFYQKVIKSAKRFLYMQTPYFVVDNKMIELLLDAKKRGVDIKVFLPSVPDKKIVYACSIKCVKPLLYAGVEIYLSNGFLHAKTLLTEDCLIIGSCNFDNRSFELNFETVAVIYDKKIMERHRKTLINQTKCATPLDIRRYKKYAIKYSISFLIYKLLSKLL